MESSTTGGKSLTYLTIAWTYCPGYSPLDWKTLIKNSSRKMWKFGNAPVYLAINSAKMLNIFKNCYNSGKIHQNIVKRSLKHNILHT